MIVCKFGGSSLAAAGQFRKVRAILEGDPKRRFAVPSAPGKRGPKDHKITDLLLLCAEHVKAAAPIGELWGLIEERFLGLERGLGVDAGLANELRAIRRRVEGGAGPAWTASRGEFLNAKLLAAFLGWDFVDAAGTIVFDAAGALDEEETARRLRAELAPRPRAVVPGFYGASPDGTVRLFSRGGSDVTGALAAASLGASLYENWTDVSGLLSADPRVVENPRPIERLSYRELREMAYMGATVLHDQAVFPLRRTDIPMRVCNANRPEDPGTLIVRDSPLPEGPAGVRGIAGRQGFTVIVMDKAMMNQERGFGRKALGVLEEHGISYEHTPTGIDSMSLVVQAAELEGKLERVVEELRRRCRPDHLEVRPEMALIAVVGRGISERPGVAGKVCSALGKRGVNIRMIDQGASGINIILGVDDADYEAAVRALYEACMPAPAAESAR